MLYIVTALKPEAQAFVDMYKLRKIKLDDVTFFVNEEICLIISGLGVDNSYKATKYILDRFDIVATDSFLNIGICGACVEYRVGELIEIGSISYGEEYVEVDEKIKNNLRCLDEEASSDKHEIVDMESYGFYKAFFHHGALKKIHILKVVSDHFEPSEVTKEKTKQLIFKNLDAINRIINR